MAAARKSALMAAIADEDTCTGLLLGGIGDKTLKEETNFLVVTSETLVTDIEAKFRTLIKRPDIAIILINQHIAEEISGLIAAHEAAVPAIVIIPSKEHTYDPSKDPEMARAKMMFAGDA